MNIFKRIKKAIFDLDKPAMSVYEAITEDLKLAKVSKNPMYALVDMAERYEEFNKFYKEIMTYEGKTYTYLYQWLREVHQINCIENFNSLDKYNETEAAWIDWMIEY